VRAALYLTAVALLAASAFFAYRVNYAAMDAYDRVARLQAQIAQEQEAIAVLRAELAFLTSPERLADLLARRGEALALAPMTGESFAAAVDIPFPPPEAFWARPDPAIFLPADDAMMAQAGP
jgi:hypothetical protein